MYSVWWAKSFRSALRFASKQNMGLLFWYSKICEYVVYCFCRGVVVCVWVCVCVWGFIIWTFGYFEEHSERWRDSVFICVMSSELSWIRLLTAGNTTGFREMGVLVKCHQNIICSGIICQHFSMVHAKIGLILDKYPLMVKGYLLKISHG